MVNLLSSLPSHISACLLRLLTWLDLVDLVEGEVIKRKILKAVSQHLILADI